jgi:hypothetical protein
MLYINEISLKEAIMPTIKPIDSSLFKMKLIKDLGPVLRKPTDTRKTRMAIFECTMCKNHFQTTVSPKAQNQLYCKDCNGTCLKKDNRDHPLYRTWATTKNKVNRTDQAVTKSVYYDRQITMCDEWKDSFDAFYEWALANGWEKGLSIDRIDNEQGYTPSNCRWAHTSTQAANQRRENKGVTGYIGVQVNLGRDGTPNGNYSVSLKWRNISYRLGNSKDKLLLAKMYDSFIMKYNLPHTKNDVLSENEYIAPTSKGLEEKLIAHPIIL